MIKDSFNFLSSSLEKLVGSLKKKALAEDRMKELFANTRAWFEESFSFETEEEKERAFEMLTEKGVYPYDYVTGLDILEQREFPHIDHFTSVLTGQSISQVDWERGERVFKTFRCESLGAYHDLYCALDTNLL